MVDVLECGLDVGQAVYRLSAAATSIRGARYACEVTETDNQKAVCAASVSAILYSLIFVATTVSQAVTDCAHKVNAPAVCTTVVTGMIANLGTIGRSASSLTQSCHLYHPLPVPPPVWNGTDWAALATTTITTTTAAPSVTPGGAKVAPLAAGANATAPNATIAVPVIPLAWIAAGVAADKATADYQTAIVNCWVFVGQAAANLARASIGISEAASKCSAEAYSQKSELTEKKCAVNIIGLLGGLGWAASFLSAAVPQCGGPGHMEAQCAADIAGLAAAIFAATAPAIQLHDQCVTLVQQMMPKGRRLAHGGVPPLP